MEILVKYKCYEIDYVDYQKKVTHFKKHLPLKSSSPEKVAVWKK